MKITLLQRNIDWCDSKANRSDLERMISDSPDTDLFVMAEMFSTGFCMTPEDMAENTANGETLQWMKCMAHDHQCALAGSVAVKEKNAYYNRLYFVYSDGAVCHYDKRHLFTYGGENMVYTKGGERVIVEYKGVRILLQICYDLRFPVWVRNNDDYDMILYVANWPTSRVAVWDVLLRARAIENQCYVIGVNRSGSDPLCKYCGHSCAIDAYGRELVSCMEEQRAAVSFFVDLDALKAFRKKFPVLSDRDGFTVL